MKTGQRHPCESFRIVHDRGLASTAQTILSSVALVSIAQTTGLGQGDSLSIVDVALFMADVRFWTDSRLSLIS